MISAAGLLRERCARPTDRRRGAIMSLREIWLAIGGYVNAIWNYPIPWAMLGSVGAAMAAWIILAIFGETIAELFHRWRHNRQKRDG